MIGEISMDKEKERQSGELEEAAERAAAKETGETKAPVWRPQDADHADRKMHTRSRVRNAQIPEGTIFYHAKPKPSISRQGIIRRRSPKIQIGPCRGYTLMKERQASQ